MGVSTPGPGRGRVGNTAVGDGLVPSRCPGNRPVLCGRRCAGDHKGRPYGVAPEFKGLGICSMGVVGRLGLEPRTNGLKARCSTN